MSRYATEAVGERLKKLPERRLDDRDYLIVYVDGSPVREPSRAGSAGRGRGWQQTEPRAPAARWRCSFVHKSLVERGLAPEKIRLFVLDGSKALHAARGQIFGAHASCNAVGTRRCGILSAVCPRGSTIRPDRCCRLPGSWMSERAASGSPFGSRCSIRMPGRSLREGLNELFTVGAIGPTPALKRCLGTTKLIDRQRALGDAPRHGRRDPVEERTDGYPLGSNRVSRGREVLLEDHWLPGPLDAQGTPRRALHASG